MLMGSIAMFLQFILQLTINKLANMLFKCYKLII